MDKWYDNNVLEMISILWLNDFKSIFITIIYHNY